MNKPGSADKIPFYFLPFALVREHGVGDGGVV